MTEKSALTPDEWREKMAIRGARQTLCVGVADGSVVLTRYRQTVILDTPEERQTTAALCLHGQPFGFTHDHVRALLYYFGEGVDQKPTGDDLRLIHEIVTRITALLPP